MENTFTNQSNNSNFLKNHPDLFLMNPKNEAYLEGKRQKPAQFNPMLTIVSTLLFGLFVFYGFGIIGKAISEWADYSILENHGIVAEASYINRSVSENSDGDKKYHITYRYTYNDLQYIREQSVNRSIYNAYQQGASVSILLDPEEPERSELSETFDAPFITLLLAILVNLSMWIFGGVLLRIILKRSRISRNSQLIEGIIRDNHSYYDDGDFNLAITYSFRSPESGQYIERKETVTRNDLQKTKVGFPQIGNTVAVLYANDKTTMLL